MGEEIRERRFGRDGAASVSPSVIAQNTNFLHGASAPLSSSSSSDACARVSLSLSLYLVQKRRYNSGSESGPQARDGRRRREGGAAQWAHSLRRKGGWEGGEKEVAP